MIGIYLGYIRDIFGLYDLSLETCFVTCLSISASALSIEFCGADLTRYSLAQAERGRGSCVVLAVLWFENGG